MRDAQCDCGHWAHDHTFLGEICTVCYCQQFVTGKLRERIRQAVDANLVAGRGSEVETITDAVMVELERDALKLRGVVV